MVNPVTVYFTNRISLQGVNFPGRVVHFLQEAGDIKADDVVHAFDIKLFVYTFQPF